jgi:hypothetical protein
MLVVVDLTCNRTLKGLFGLDGNPYSNRVLIRRPVAHSHFPFPSQLSRFWSDCAVQPASLQWVTEGGQIGISIIAYMGT